ncbi:hypothetical protein E3N88_16579 [Mikania micrantha]|uniref:Ty3 transposon capsid-like protein domain-containing protein n=1 Tax=Mikania micrantha TaxID=192012 RepID=A0A5N6NYU4_9ASTR|nr:hypothetical protein E3N88_16579 [Mikania micrantha]
MCMGGGPGPTESSTGLPWAVKKIKLPEFSGFDPQGWIQKATLYFDINNTPDELRIRLAQLSMVGVAQHWFTIITQVRDSLSWVEFQSELQQQFSGLEIYNLYEQLATIKHGDSIYDYIDDFEYLLSLVPRLPESQALGYFIAGLQDDVKRWVRLHRPLSRLDAMYLAKDVEGMLRPNSSSGNVSQSCFRYLNIHGSLAGGQSDGSSVLAQLEPKTFSGSKMAERTSSIRQPFNPQSPLSSQADGGHVFQRDRGVRSLSRTEWEERRKKGLCYKCGQPFSPSHKCPDGQLRVLLLGDDELETHEGLHFQLEHRDNDQSLEVLQKTARFFWLAGIEEKVEVVENLVLDVVCEEGRIGGEASDVYEEWVGSGGKLGGRIDRMEIYGEVGCGDGVGDG